jgi:hypothetical protein
MASPLFPHLSCTILPTMEFNTYGTDCWSEALQFFMLSLLLLAVLQHDIAAIRL